MILICLLYTCDVWIESVDPVADSCLTNQVLYGTILSSTAEQLIAYAIPLLVLVAAIIGPLQDPVTWYGINYAGTQMTQWDFQNKGTRTSPARLSFVLEVPLRHLRPSVIYSVPCDRILQRAYYPQLPCELTEKLTGTAVRA